MTRAESDSRLDTASLCRSSVGAVLIAGLLLAAVYAAQGGRAPSGQPQLIGINSQALPGLQAEFNRTSAGLRVILLLSNHLTDVSAGGLRRQEALPEPVLLKGPVVKTASGLDAIVARVQ